MDKKLAPRGKDIYDGEFSRRAPIFRKAAQHFESIFGFLIKLKNLVCYFCVAKVMVISDITKCFEGFFQAIETKGSTSNSRRGKGRKKTDRSDPSLIFGTVPEVF